MSWQGKRKPDTETEGFLYFVCQYQCNYMDIETQAGVKGLKYAASKELAVVIMEPLLAGKLATAPPSVQATWDSAPQKRRPADWALQWLWNQPEVSIVLSGMNLMEHVEENLSSASWSGIGKLAEEELDLIDRVRDAYKELGAIPCTACRYCVPCPNGVDIRIISINRGRGVWRRRSRRHTPQFPPNY